MKKFLGNFILFFYSNIYALMKGCVEKMPKKNNLTGYKFHYLTVLKPTEKRNSGGSILWEC